MKRAPLPGMHQSDADMDDLGKDDLGEDVWGSGCVRVSTGYFEGFARGLVTRIYVPHSCDEYEWVVGDEEDAALMIQDLKAAIGEMKRRGKANDTEGGE